MRAPRAELIGWAAVGCLAASYALFAFGAHAGWVRLSWDATAGATSIRSGCVAPGQYERAPVNIAAGTAGSTTIDGLPDTGRCYFTLNAGPQDEWAFDFATLSGGRLAPGSVRNLAVTTSEALPVMARVGGAFAQFNPGQSGSIAWPSGTRAGHGALVVCSWYERYNSAVPTLPAEFRALTPSVVIGGSGNTESRAQLFSAVLDGPRTGTVAVSFTGSVYANCVLDVYQGPSPFKTITATAGTVTNGTVATVPASSGAGYVVWAFALTDPATMTAPGGAQLGQVGGSNTNTARYFFEPNWGATLARSSTLGTGRGSVGFTAVLQ